MEPEQFVYWLNGFLELSEAETLTKKQLAVVRDHLALVVTKISPSRRDPDVVEQIEVAPKAEPDPAMVEAARKTRERIARLEANVANIGRRTSGLTRIC